MTNQQDYADLLQFSFGDNPEMADALLNLVLSGRKTATCSALDVNEQMSKVDDRQVVLNGLDQASCVIEITDVAVVRFCDVTAGFAYLEGEGDRSLACWQRDHEAFFRREGQFSPEMLLVCEQFRVVHTF